MRDTRTYDDGVLQQLVERLVAAVAPSEIRLFGSRARGSATPDSDYDLLVVAESKLPRVELAFRARKAIRDLGVAVDLVFVTPDEQSRLSTWRSSVVYDATHEGRVVYATA
jgi:predicted nucleotidyltransferase